MLTVSTYRHRHRILPRHPGQPEEGLGGPHPEAGTLKTIEGAPGEAGEVLGLLAKGPTMRLEN